MQWYTKGPCRLDDLDVSHLETFQARTAVRLDDTCSGTDG